MASESVQELRALGGNCFSQGNLSDAMIYAKKVLSIETDNVWALGMLGNLEIRLNQDYEKAVEYLDRALTVEPSGEYAGTLWASKVFAFLQLGRYDESLRCLSRCEEILPGLPDLPMLKEEILKRKAVEKEESLFSAKRLRLLEADSGSQIDLSDLNALMPASKKLWDNDPTRAGAQSLYWWLEDKLKSKDASIRLDDHDMALMRAIDYVEKFRLAAAKDERTSLIQKALKEARRAMPARGANVLIARLEYSLG